MTERPIHGHTKSGRPITDQDIESLAAEAEAGSDVETLIARRNKRGRPTLGNAPPSVESVREALPPLPPSGLTSTHPRLANCATRKPCSVRPAFVSAPTCAVASTSVSQARFGEARALSSD